MKSKLLRLIKWFCRHLTYNDLASVIVVLHEVLSDARKDIELKPDEKPPHYRNFRVDIIPPLIEPPTEIITAVSDWKTLLLEYKHKHNKDITPVKSRKGSPQLPPGCRCQHCNAPRKYLYLNNGKQASQVMCKICHKTSPVHRIRKQSAAKYWCPHCSGMLSKWKESSICTIYKCFSLTCSHYLDKCNSLTAEEKNQRQLQKYDPNFKLHYQYREFHLAQKDLETARPKDCRSKVDLNRIHNNHHVVGLVLTFMINLGLSARVTKKALKGIFGIPISHQTVINYANAAAARISSLVDRWKPAPSGIAAADETYIIVDSRWHYTWFIIDSVTRAICGYNLSTTRGAVPALATLYDCYGQPEQNSQKPVMVTDGNPSYDTAVMAFNAMGKNKLEKHTVIGLENLDPESEEYRCFKQIVERLNRTYKYHTRPRAGFKTFEGAVALTTLFVAYYNFMRPHSAIGNSTPVQLDCLKDVTLMPQAWLRFLDQAA
jgi:transposase-like protein